MHKILISSVTVKTLLSHSRAGIEDSKKWGMLFLVNQLFKIYFKVCFCLRLPTNLPSVSPGQLLLFNYCCHWTSLACLRKWPSHIYNPESWHSLNASHVQSSKCLTNVWYKKDLSWLQLVQGEGPAHWVTSSLGAEALHWMIRSCGVIWLSVQGPYCGAFHSLFHINPVKVARCEEEK
jgi:hypothetical protein